MPVKRRSDERSSWMQKESTILSVIVQVINFTYCARLSSPNSVVVSPRYDRLHWEKLARGDRRVFD